MATYAMPREADELTKRIFEDGMRAAAEALAAKFGDHARVGKVFDLEDAIRALQLGETKLDRKHLRGPSPKKVEAKVSKKTKKDASAPKQVKFNGYLVFGDEHRAAAKLAVEAKLAKDGVLVNKPTEKNPEPADSTKVMAKHVTSELGRMWTKLTKEEQSPWNAKAAQRKADRKSVV